MNTHPHKFRRVAILVSANVAVLSGTLAAIELGCRISERTIPQPASEPPRSDWVKLPPKDSSELRVFLFGGSTVYGVPVREVAFAAQTRYWLQRLYPDRNIRIYNFAYPGEDTAKALAKVVHRLQDQPDLMVVVSGHNEFLPFATSAAGPAKRSARQVLANHSAAMRLIERYVASSVKHRTDTVMPDVLLPLERQSDAFQHGIAAYRQCIRDIILRTRQKGAPLILGTLPSNLGDWPPVYKRLPGRDRQYSDLIARIQGLLLSGRHAEGSEAIARGFERYPQDAMLYFLRGKFQSAAGAYADAGESFVKARDLDPLPWRTIGQLNSIIRQEASRMPGVHLLDLEKLYAGNASHGIVGSDLILDNVHGTPFGESIGAQALIQSMADLKLLPAGGTGQNACCPVEPFLAAIGYFEPKSPLHLHVLLDSAIFVMKTPFLNYDLSRRYLLEALKVDKDSWEVWANLATVSYLNGDASSGAKELATATELHRGPINVNDRNITPYLKEALKSAAGQNVPSR